MKYLLFLYQNVSIHHLKSVLKEYHTHTLNISQLIYTCMEYHPEANIPLHKPTL